MIKRPRERSVHATGALFAILIAACNGASGDDSDFLTACLKEGENTASQMLDKEMGVTREAFCKCGAKAAKASLSKDAYRAMVLDMQGRKQEATAITSKMSEFDQMALFKGMSEVFDTCAAGAK
jgi:hypothetical protein